MMKKAIIWLGLALFVVGAWSGTAQSDPKVKIGYVDLQSVIEASEKGRELRERLFQFRKEKEKILSGKQEEVNQMRQDFQQKALTLSERARLDKEQQLRQKELEFKNLSETYRQEILLEGRKLQTIMFRELSGIVSSIGKEGGYTVILDKDTVLWANSAIDITDEVIKAYNAKMSAK